MGRLGSPIDDCGSSETEGRSTSGSDWGLGMVFISGVNISEMMGDIMRDTAVGTEYKYKIPRYPGTQVPRDSMLMHLSLIN